MSEYTINANEAKGTTQADNINNINQYYGSVTILRNGKEIRLPFQIPNRAQHFTDRKYELSKLLHDIRPGSIVTLCGPGGIGKSALAAEVIWALTSGEKPPEQFPDGVIFHNFYRVPESNSALEHIALSFGEESRPTPYEAAQRALSGRQALLLLDGTEDADNLPAILEVTGNCGVIVTSRLRKDAVEKPQDIESLELDEAVKLLNAWNEDQDKNGEGDDTSVRRICELVGGLPLAVRLAGRYLMETGETAAEYLEWLEDTPLDALDQGNRRLESVPLLLKRSLDQVSESARDVLSVSGMLAFSPFARDVIEAALPDVQMRRPLNELVVYGLLHRSEDRFEVSHALIHTYARMCLASDDAVLERVAGYYNAFARKHREHGLDGYARLDLERAHIMKVMEGCREREEWETAKSLAWAIEDYLDVQGYWAERIIANETGLESSRQLNDQQEEGNWLGNLGLAYSALGQVEKAIEYHEQALAISREIGHRQGEGNHLGNLGLAYSDLGQVEKAIEYHEQALAISREIGHRQGEGSDLGNLGIAYSALGQVEKAKKYLKESLAIFEEIKSPNADLIKEWIEGL